MSSLSHRLATIRLKSDRLPVRCHAADGQYSGTDASRLEEAMRSVTPWVTERAAKYP